MSILCDLSIAQTVFPNKDLESWSTVQLNYKVNKKWKVNAQEQFRLKKNSTQMESLFTQFEGKYNLNKRVDFAFGSRYTLENDNLGRTQGMESHFRYHVDALYKYGFDNYEFEYRLRYQKSNQMWKSHLQGDYPSREYRLRGSIKYKIKNWKLDPTGSYEIFHKKQIGELNGFDRYRLVLGSSYKVSKKLKFNFGLIKQKQFRIWNPKVTYAVKLKLICTL